MQLPRLLFLLLLISTLANAQFDRVNLVSDKPGRSEAKVAGVVLYADQASWNGDSSELTMRGHVHAVLPSREDHTVVRYGTGVMITDQPIGLTADRVTVKDGLLRAYGNIVLVPDDPELPKVQLRADEMYMHLRIADVSLRGNVRPKGIHEPEMPTPAGFRPTKVIFPPDIIK